MNEKDKKKYIETMSDDLFNNKPIDLYPDYGLIAMIMLIIIILSIGLTGFAIYLLGLF